MKIAAMLGKMLQHCASLQLGVRESLVNVNVHISIALQKYDAKQYTKENMHSDATAVI